MTTSDRRAPDRERRDRGVFDLGVTGREPSGRRARVIAVNRFYRPDHSATSQILTDLAEDLERHGRPVTVIATRTRYDDADACLPAHEVSGGVTIRRVWSSRLGRRSLAGRGVDYLAFYATATLALMREARAGDVVLAKTDPPLLSVPAALVARAKRARLVTWNHDLFPEVAGALGFSWVAGGVGRLMARLRDASLRSAAMNVAISPAMGRRIAAAGVPPERIRVIENWSDRDVRPVDPAANPLRSAWGLEGAFVIGYSGNLGRAHLAGQVAELVRRTHDLPGVAWLFIGGGSGQARIRALVAETGAGNVRFEPYQPRERLAASLSLPDLHLVSLDPACEGLIMPSKLAGIMAAGRPTLFLGDPSGEVADRLERAGAGLVLDPGRPESWRAAVDALRGDPTRLAGMAAGAAALARVRGAARALAAWRGVIDGVAAEAAAVGVAGVMAERRGAAARRLARAARRLQASPAGRVLARGGFLALAGGAAAIALTPGFNFGSLQWLKDAVGPFAQVAAFAALTLGGALAWGVSLPLLGGLGGLAVALELGQTVAPGRDPTLVQLVASLVGISVGWLMARPWAREIR